MLEFLTKLHSSFVRRDIQTYQKETDQLLEDLVGEARKGQPFRPLQDKIAEYYFRRPIQVTGHDPYLPPFLRNWAIRPFWRDNQPTPPLKSENTPGYPKGHW